MSEFSEKTTTEHKQEELIGNVGDAIYKTVCHLCGAIREDKQIGLEETPEEYIARLVDIFREVRRVLKDEGTLWINIGDSYAGGQGRWGGVDNLSDIQNGNKGSLTEINVSRKWKHDIIKPKDLIGIPWMLAFALRSDGWYLRQDIIWHKPNPMPESVKDRCTKSHEYIFLFSKSSKYYFDYKSIQEPCNYPDAKGMKFGSNKYGADVKGFEIYSGEEYEANGFRNKRDVWNISDISYANSKYTDANQEASVRCGMNKTRGEHILELRKNLPLQSEFVEFMRSRTNVNALSEILDTPRTTIEHWFRTDNSGFSYPSIDEWNKLCEILNDGSEEFNSINRRMSEISYETDDINKNNEGVRNKRDVWSVIPSHYKEAHFATFPEELVLPMLLAGCPSGGVVLDPFMGSGTTGVVAKNNNRMYVGCELNADYVEMAENRLNHQQIRLF